MASPVKLGIGMVSFGRRGKLGSVGIWRDPVGQVRLVGLSLVLVRSGSAG